MFLMFKTEYYEKKIIKNKGIVGLDIKAEFPKNPDILIKNDFKKNPRELSEELFQKNIKLL